MHKIDLSNYDLRTDLIIEKKVLKSKINKYNYKNIEIEEVTLKDNKILSSKPGKYVTISFKDITDTDNYENVLYVLKKELCKVLNYLKIPQNASCLVIGLGNNKIISDALGSKVLEKIIVTRHLYLLDNVDLKYRNVSIIEPSVIGVTGIESYEIIKNVIKEIKPNFVIAIDSLCAADIKRLNKTIQISTNGITPGSGIGNSRCELSYNTLGLNVIAVGVPTVVDSSVIVSDTIKYFVKKISYLKYSHKLIDRLKPIDKINYSDSKYHLTENEKKELLGYIGLLSETDLRKLIWETLSPIELNMIVTVKEIDYIMEKMSSLISDGINKALHHID